MDRKYVKVLALMQARPEGRIAVNDPELVALLESRHRDAELGAVAYRMANYVSEIRRFGKLEVKGIREGRAVVAYQLVALANGDAQTSNTEPQTTATDAAAAE